LEKTAAFLGRKIFAVEKKFFGVRSLAFFHLLRTARKSFKARMFLLKGSRKHFF